MEIRDRATFVPATAIRLSSIGQIAAVAARSRLRPRAPIDRAHQFTDEGQYDPHRWTNRTMHTVYLRLNFDEVPHGSAVDVEHI